MIVTAFNSSCYYHPTKVIFLDDDRDLLDALELEFGSTLNIETYTDPTQVLKRIACFSKDVFPTVLKEVNKFDTDTLDQMIGCQMNQLINLIYDGTRFNQTPVIVVDYQMPEMNGIDFCRQLKGNGMFKIMLTAEADKNIAVQAFNEGIIDKFILKTSENMCQELLDAIDDLNQQYFIKSSRSMLAGNGNHIIKMLSENHHYKSLINHVLTESRAVEYYMADHSGSFLFLDKNATPTWIIIRNEKELNEQLALLEGYDIFSADRSCLEKKEKMLFLFSEAEYKKPVSEWVKLLFEAKKLDDHLFYCVITGRVTDTIDWEKIASYSKSRSNSYSRQIEC